MNAIEVGNKEVCQYLISRENVNPCEKVAGWEQTPLEAAFAQNNKKIIDIIKQSSAYESSERISMLEQSLRDKEAAEQKFRAAHEEEVRNLQATIKEARQAQEEKDQSLSRMTQQLININTQLYDVKTAAQREHEITKGNFDAFKLAKEKEKTDLASRLEQTATSLATLSAEFEESKSRERETSEELQRKLAQAEHDKEELNTRSIQANNDLETARAHLTTLTTDKEDKERQIQYLRTSASKESAELTAKMQALEEKLQENNRSKEEAQSRYLEAQNKLTELQTVREENNNLRKQLAQSIKATSEKSTQTTTEEDVARTMQADRQALAIRLNKGARRKKELEKKLRAATKKPGNKRKRLRMLRKLRRIDTEARETTNRMIQTYPSETKLSTSIGTQTEAREQQHISTQSTQTSTDSKSVATSTEVAPPRPAPSEPERQLPTLDYKMPSIPPMPSPPKYNAEPEQHSDTGRKTSDNMLMVTLGMLFISIASAMIGFPVLAVLAYDAFFVTGIAGCVSKLTEANKDTSKTNNNSVMYRQRCAEQEAYIKALTERQKIMEQQLAKQESVKSLLNASRAKPHGSNISRQTQIPLQQASTIGSVSRY
jgi:hypothetical protein